MIVVSRAYDQYSFQVIPVMGQLISGQYRPYQYLVQSIRNFPDQVSYGNVQFSLIFKDCCWMVADALYTMVTNCVAEQIGSGRLRETFWPFDSSPCTAVGLIDSYVLPTLTLFLPRTFDRPHSIPKDVIVPEGNKSLWGVHIKKHTFYWIHLIIYLGTLSLYSLMLVISIWIQLSGSIPTVAQSIFWWFFYYTLHLGEASHC